MNLIYPTNALSAEVEAAPCTHREIVMSLYNLTINLRDSEKRCVVVTAWKNYDVYSYATTFNSYLDSNLHMDGASSVWVSSEYITELFTHLEYAHRMHTQVTLSDKSKSNGHDSDNKHHKRKHSVQAFNAQGLARHDADHAGRKRSAPSNRQVVGARALAAVVVPRQAHPPALTITLTCKRTFQTGPRGTCHCHCHMSLSNVAFTYHVPLHLPPNVYFIS